ncbi:hypothetical protein HKX48_006873, partial [Thoreauomyces humboldtii]
TPSISAPVEVLPTPIVRPLSPVKVEVAPTEKPEVPPLALAAEVNTDSPAPKAVGKPASTDAKASTAERKPLSAHAQSHSARNVSGGASRPTSASLQKQRVSSASPRPGTASSSSSASSSSKLAVPAVRKGRSTSPKGGAAVLRTTAPRKPLATTSTSSVFPRKPLSSAVERHRSADSRGTVEASSVTVLAKTDAAKAPKPQVPKPVEPSTLKTRVTTTLAERTKAAHDRVALKRAAEADALAMKKPVASPERKISSSGSGSATGSAPARSGSTSARAKSPVPVPASRLHLRKPLVPVSAPGAPPKKPPVATSSTASPRVPGSAPTTVQAKPKSDVSIADVEKQLTVAQTANHDLIVKHTAEILSLKNEHAQHTAERAARLAEQKLTIADLTEKTARLTELEEQNEQYKATIRGLEMDVITNKSVQTAEIRSREALLEEVAALKEQLASLRAENERLNDLRQDDDVVVVVAETTPPPRSPTPAQLEELEELRAENKRLLLEQEKSDIVVVSRDIPRTDPEAEARLVRKLEEARRREENLLSQVQNAEMSQVALAGQLAVRENRQNALEAKILEIDGKARKLLGALTKSQEKCRRQSDELKTARAAAGIISPAAEPDNKLAEDSSSSSPLPSLPSSPLRDIKARMVNVVPAALPITETTTTRRHSDDNIVSPVSPSSDSENSKTTVSPARLEARLDRFAMRVVSESLADAMDVLEVERRAKRDTQRSVVA